jgi:AcrR family transcriptional regulator
MKVTEKKPRGRPLKFEQNAVLEMALKQFWIHGFEGTSISDLTSAMGIHRPSLYAAFGNKTALFKSCVTHYLSNELNFIEETLKTAPLLIAIDALLAREIALIEKGRGCFLVKGAISCREENNEIKELLNDHRKTFEGKLRRRVQMAQMKNEVASTDSPAAIAKYIASIYQGLSIQASGGATKRELQEVAKIALKALILR